MSQSRDELRRLIGKIVRVKLDEKVVHTGLLIGWGTDGQFELLDESDGSIHYCWPLLSAEEVTE